MLEDHENKGRKIQVEGGEGRLEDGLVGAENTDEKLREEAEEDPYRTGIAQAEQDHDPDGVLDVLVPSGSVVIAHDRGSALGDREQGCLKHLAGGVDDRHDGDVEVSSDVGEHAVAADRDDAVGELHDEGGHAQTDDPAGPGEAFGNLVQAQQMQAVFDLVSEEEAQDKEGGQRLGEYGGDGGTPDAHAADKDEDGIQDNVGDSTDDDSCHTDGGVSLGIDKGVHARRDHGKNGSDQIDPQVGKRVDQRLFRGSESDQDRAADDLADDGQYYSCGDLKEKGRILDPVRFFPVSCPAGD